MKGPDEQIIEIQVDDFIRALENDTPEIARRYNNPESSREIPPPAFLKDSDESLGEYVFLVGAGTSKPEPAGISTAGELVEAWVAQEYQDDDNAEEIVKGAIWRQLEGVEEIMNNVGINGLKSSESFSEANSKVRKMIYKIGREEDEMKAFQNEYGFWFQERYGNQAARRKFIRELVEDRDPPFGMVVLGLLMENGYVPITLTPNFDDLLFDAFYLFLDQKPQVINYDAIASQFKVTANRPTIVKLHGDHLNYNLRNTGPETYELSENIHDAISRTLREYGLVVVGYGGSDESIMGVLEDLDIPSQGIYWCARDRNELSQRARELLKKPNTFYVEIDGSDEFFTKIIHQIEDLQLPIPNEIKDLGEDRAALYDKIVRRQKKEVQGEEMQLFNEYQVISKSNDLREEGLYDEAIEELDSIIELGQRSPRLLYERGNIKIENEDYESAIDDLSMSIDINEVPAAFNSRGIAYSRSGEYSSAINDFQRAADFTDGTAIDEMENIAEAKLLDGKPEEVLGDAGRIYEEAERDENIAIALLLKLLANLTLDQDTTPEEEKYEKVCDREFNTTWEFIQMNRWIGMVDLDKNSLDDAKKWIEMLKGHKFDNGE